ncbi:MAG TPA: hypothetical protein PKK94_12030, partial [Leptospiraceae bacterium]|nr:hypothetical protein [Leptospiraceae bacterium]
MLFENDIFPFPSASRKKCMEYWFLFQIWQGLGHPMQFIYCLNVEQEWDTKAGLDKSGKKAALLIYYLH